MSNTESLSVELKQAFLRLIAQQTGLVIKEADQDNLIETILVRIKFLKFGSPESYYQLLKSSTIESNQEWQNLVRFLTNNETYFWRDKGQFNTLKNYIIPKIIQQQNNHKTIRICSAGCSTGEEPYSLAILLHKLLPDLERWKVTIFGIDINQDALKTAKKGIYSSWSFRSLNPDRKSDYFRIINNYYHIDNCIKKMVTFKTVNLIKDSFKKQNSELKDLDLILCRNVFIYFEYSAKAKVLDKFYHSLKPLGYLITGHGELYGHNLSKFQTKVFPESLVYQRRADNLILQTPPLVSLTSEAKSPPVKNLSLDVLQKSRRSEREPITEAFSNTQKTNVARDIWSVDDTPINIIKSQENTKFKKTTQEVIREVEILLQQDAYDLAIKQLKNLLTIHYNNFQAYYLMAQIHANLGKYEEAIHYCQQALDIDSLSVSPYYLLAQIAEEQGNLVEAKRILKKIIYLEPSSIIAYLDMIHIYQKEGNQQRIVKMKQIVINILKQLSPKTIIKDYENMTAAELIIKIKTELNDY
ncbi:tetratricopeptide repeat protein [Moorena producens JHB]|uniref:protein-glutamate O-methyltransferase n=1 Tax=Moorena producens (strain JHB) TaxID=1454205 RepID=A0A1D9G4T1_MOOP1|nr:protein-glutamate O-methyltransferase CheR [Moorena producens]AOY82420.1 tetratricopeptide repeat protein [Moorena producens JHB]